MTVSPLEPSSSTRLTLLLCSAKYLLFYCMNQTAYAPLSKREGDSSKHVGADAATRDVQHQQPYGYGVQGKGSSPDAHMRDDDSETDMEMEFLLANSISVMFVR
uniref:Uncharacterized protein n=1 Tax=Brassica oleracea var. oleracea TaxID=109376 RepID=A0A0D3CMN2_BRAOL